MNRRAFLRTSVGAGIATSVIVGTIPGSTAAEPSGSITLDDQTSSDGQTLVITTIEVEQEATLGIINQRADEGIYSSTIEPGTYEEYEVNVGPPFSEESEVSVSLYPEGGGSSFARDTAFVSVPDNLEVIDGINQTLIEPDPADDFEYPFYLYAPRSATGGDTDSVPLLVEPANSGQVDNDIGVHLSAGDRLVESSGTRDIADELGSPLVVPVFPRPRDDPVDGSHYIHALDDTSMSIEEGPLERVDLQLLNMVERAHKILENEDYPVRTDGILLNGFSASGNFVDRFTFLHPKEVISVTAGGVNGMPLLPQASVGGEPLPFHVGTADIEEYIGEPVDLDAVDDVNQFLYMGEEDTNDTIPFDDAWTDDDLRQLALDVYGEDMIAERFVRAQELYAEAGVEAHFRVYRGAGHTPRPAHADIVEFHRKSMEDIDVSDYGEDLTSEAGIRVVPESPTVDESITFEATSLPADRGTNVVTWDFDDDETAVGETVTHEFEEHGTYRIVMTVSYDDGTQENTSYSLDVSDQEDNMSTSTDDGISSTDDDIPGFGVGGAVMSIGGFVYMLQRRLSRTEAEEEFV